MPRILPVLLVSLFALSVSAAEKELHILAVVGRGGDGEYERVFQESAQKWREAAAKGNAAFTLIGEGADKEKSTEKFREAIAAVEETELWIVLIGHGTFDGRSVKFNVHGPDFTDADLAGWLGDFPGDVVVINTASASGSFVQSLKGPDRIVITATKNQAEIFYTRFGKYFADAIGGLEDADLDNDDQVSLLESFLYASDRVANFYETEGRLATEHALIEDSGDGVGSRSEWFEGTVATRTPGKDAAPDGERSGQKVLVKNEFERRLTPEQRTRRDALEREVRQLRRDRESLEEAAYYEKLETLLLELARLYREVADKGS